MCLQEKDIKMNEELKQIINPLIKWYEINKRILPWREEKNPYQIWISEVMLQQTRIEAVKKYYTRFMKQLPTIKELANVEEDELLKLWEGLGYYNRARNLKKAAIIILEQYNENMPTTYAELMKLPGIGEYTAGAIASIAYNEKVPAVDGNVLRVISRVIGNDKNILEQKVKQEITEMLYKMMPEQAGNFNESLMELGEVICLPNQEPECNKCPIKEYCYAFKYHVTTKLPVRIKQLKRKIERKTIFLLTTKEDKIAVTKRGSTGLLAGMYEFPNIERDYTENELSEILKTWNLNMKDIVSSKRKQHIFTHITWDMIGYEIIVENENDRFLWVSKKELRTKYALPTAFAKFL